MDEGFRLAALPTRQLSTRGRAVAAAVVLAIVAVVAFAVVRHYRIPPQGSGDDWRVLGTAEFPGFHDEAHLTADPTAYLPDADALAAGSAALIVPIWSGTCERVRVKDVDFRPTVLAIEVGRYRGFGDRHGEGCTDDIADSHFLVLEVPIDRMAAIDAVLVDQAPPIPLIRD